MLLRFPHRDKHIVPFHAHGIGGDGFGRGQREHVPQVKNVGVNIVWSPPWNPEMMSDDAKMELGFF